MSIIERMGRWTISLAVILAILSWCSTAVAGRGTYEIHSMAVDGNQQDVAVIDLYMESSAGLLNQNLLDKFETALDKANKILWDATEGQFLVDKLYVIERDRRATDQFPDIIHVNAPGDSVVSPSVVGSDIKAIGSSNVQITWRNDLDMGLKPGVLAHEFVHYILTCADGYKDRPSQSCSAKPGTGATKVSSPQSGMGNCIEPKNQTPTKSTLTQHADGVTAGDTVGSELCTASNHDPVKGCGRQDQTLTTAQTFSSKKGPSQTVRSCWEAVDVTWSHASPPSGSPKTKMPSGYESPEIVDLQTQGNYVSLILDRSGSMGWATTGDRDEVCNDGKDNDRDGTTDEADCAIPRIEFLQAGARAFLRLAEYRDGMNVGIVSFATNPKIETNNSNFLEANSSNISTLENIVNNLSPANSTAIGDALVKTRDLFKNAAIEDGATQWGILYSDGKHNAGRVDPLEGAKTLAEEEKVRVSTVGTGRATQQSTLIKIKEKTQAAKAFMMKKHTDMISAFAQQMAQHINAELQIPLLRWKINRGEPANTIDRDGWFEEGYEDSDLGQIGGKKLTTTTNIPEETKNVTVVVGGTLDKMPNGFGVELRFTGPEGQTYDTDANSSKLEVHRDPFFMTVWLKEPQVGDWDIELRPQPKAAEIQKGTLTVYTDAPQMRTGIDVEPRHVPSSRTTADLEAFSAYQMPTTEYAGIRVAVQDPTGKFSGFSTTTTERGTIEGTLQSSGYHGSHRVQLLYETNEETYTYLGDPIDPDDPVIHNVPSMNYGEWDSVFFEKGSDPGVDYRSE